MSFTITFLGMGASSAEAYEAEMKIANEQKAAALEKFASQMETMEPSGDAGVLAAGEKTFIVSCCLVTVHKGKGWLDQI
jgi:hypothetical protein